MIPKSTGSLIVPCVRAGDVLYVSGHTPVGADGKSVVGRLGKDMKVNQGQEAARLVALRVLSTELGSLERVVRVVKTLGMVNCTPEFTQMPQVVNGFSELLAQVFGDAAGKGARSAVGMVSLRRRAGRGRSDLPGEVSGPSGGRGRETGKAAVVRALS